MAKILVIDDEPGIRLAFEAMLSDLGHYTLLADCCEQGLSLGKLETPDIIFLDHRLPDCDGITILPELLGLESNPAVICMTAYGDMSIAVTAMKEGAYEYLTKPLDLKVVAELIKRIINSRAGSAHAAPATKDSFDGPVLIGNSPVMQETFKLIGMLTNNMVTVLITGESGVGKELVARAIHHNSPRSSNPFIAVNCGAIPKTLIESELFGHEQGAFTGADSLRMGRFEQAANGTLFLDEVAELDPSAQVKLLRVLQEQTFERVGGSKTVKSGARIIAATNCDLADRVKQGGFRQDLYYRLHMMAIHVPPLREHRADIPMLAAHFLAQSNRELNLAIKGIDQRVIEKLTAYRWPGNIRQLQHQIRRAAVLCRDPYLSLHHLHLEENAPSGQTDSNANLEKQLTTILHEYLKSLIEGRENEGRIYHHATDRITGIIIDEALKICNGNQVLTSDLLGISRSTLRKKIGDSQ